MSWVPHPLPEEAGSEYGREVLRSSLERNRGQLGMMAAFYTFPQGADHMTRFVEAVHFGDTALPRVYKEMIATVVSSANGCQY